MTSTITHPATNRKNPLPLLTAEEQVAHISELKEDLAEAQYRCEWPSARKITAELSMWKRFGPWMTPAN